MYSANEINKIFLTSSMNLYDINITTLLFNNSLAVSKKRYSVIDSYINVLDQIENNLCMIYNSGSAEYYEYNMILNSSSNILPSVDIFDNSFTSLYDKSAIVFVDGYKLLPHEFTLDLENNHIIINRTMSLNKMNKIIVYLSSKIQYIGNVAEDLTWELSTLSFTLNDYSTFDYIFFKNGELIPHNKITYTDGTIKFNLEYRDGVDLIEYYKMPSDTQVLLFEEEPGYFSFGPKDNFSVQVPEVYDSIAEFDTIARLAIDDIRKGFFIREVDGNGCVSIIQDDFETKKVKCIKINSFSEQRTYNKNEYYVQVPEAKSILKYISEYDLKGQLFPELLGIFQRVLLDETYDTVQRLKNIRSINNVDSSQITKLINFLGMNINVTNISLEQKHALLEELNGFYKTVGTKSSYNFYNLLNTDKTIINIDQLFTPIRDIDATEEYGEAKRYVDFRTPEELGAVWKKEYRIPRIDYGYVDELAIIGESFTNTPRDEGILEDIPRGEVNWKKDNQVYHTAILNSNWTVYKNDVPEKIRNPYGEIIGYREDNKAYYTNGTIMSNKIGHIYIERDEQDDDDVRYVIKYDGVEVGEAQFNPGYDVALSDTNEILGYIGQKGKTSVYNKQLSLNKYIKEPLAGPNTANLDYGYIIDKAESFYDYGLVSDPIKGTWIQWLDWDRPRDWYATNHVNVELSIPATVDYDTFMNEFKSVFYEIASTVVYIHEIIQVYDFGDNGKGGTNDGTTNKNGGFSLLSGLVHQHYEETFTNDPSRQPGPNVLVE